MGTKRKQCLVYLTDKSNDAISHYQRCYPHTKSECCNVALSILGDLLDGKFSIIADPPIVIVGNTAFNLKEGIEDEFT